MAGGRIITAEKRGAGPDRCPATRPLRAGIGLGANLGEPLGNLRRAVASLRDLHAGGAFFVSGVFATEPVGCPPGAPPFLNAAVELGWNGAADDLLARLAAIERALGRPAARPKNAPRAIDLDLLYFGSERLATAGLTIPHPRLAERRFVLAPLADIRPELVVPGLGATVAELLAGLPPKPAAAKLAVEL